MENDPEKEITIQEVLSKITSEIEAQKRSIDYYISTLFKNHHDATTIGKLFAAPYWSLLEFKYKNGYLTLKTPYYVSRIYVSEDVGRLFKCENFDTCYCYLLYYKS